MAIQCFSSVHESLKAFSKEILVKYEMNDLSFVPQTASNKTERGDALKRDVFKR